MLFLCAHVVEKEAEKRTKEIETEIEVMRSKAATDSHYYDITKTAEVGFFSDLYDLYHVEYDAEFTGINHVSIGPSVFYEYYDSSGGFSEKAHRIGATIGIRYSMTNSLTLGLDYRYLWKDSNLDGGDYTQNLVFLSAFYKF